MSEHGLEIICDEYLPPGVVEVREGDVVVARFNTFKHEPMNMAEAASEFAYCLRGVLYYVLYPLRAFSLCEFGWHQWCSCCSPMFCTRCQKKGPD